MYFKTVTYDYQFEKNLKKQVKRICFNKFNCDIQSYAKIIKYLYSKHTRPGYYRRKVIMENISEIENGSMESV